MRTLLGRLVRIGRRRAVLTLTLAVGGVLMVGSLAWACSPLVHQATFEIAPATSTCEQVSSGSYSCTPVVATIAGHGESCDPDSVGCKSTQPVFQDKTPRPKPNDTLQQCGTNGWEIGQLKLRAVQDVPSVAGDPVSAEGWWRVGRGVLDPQVASSHPSGEVKWYGVCTGPYYNTKPLGIAKL